MNQIFRWSPALRSKKDGDKYGVFQCKCPETTQGAVRYQGETPMVKWDFWAIDCGKISGKLVWIDKNFQEFNGKTKTSLSLAFQTEDGDIDILSMPFDGFALRNVMNHLCGMKDKVLSDQISLTYGTWKKKDSDGKFVVGADGKQVWNTSLNFEGIAPLYSLSKDVQKNYWEMRKDKGIEPIKFVDSKGNDSYDDRAEMEFWDKPLVGLQKKLVESGNAIPFSYNSWTCGDAVNFSGGGNQTDEIKEKIKQLYESKVKGAFIYFNKESGTGVSAGDVRSALKQSAQVETEQAQEARIAALSTPSNTAQPTRGGFADPVSVPLPTQDTTNFEVGAEPGDDGSDLPF